MTLPRPAEDWSALPWEPAAVLRAALGLTPATVAVDTAGLLRLWSPAAEDLFGWPAADVLGGRDPSVTDDGRPQAEGVLDRVLAGDVISPFATRRRARDGRVLDLTCSAAAVPGAGGRPGGALFAFQPLPAHPPRAAPPSDVENLWRPLVEQNPDVIVLALRDTTLSYVNRIESGFRPEEVLGRRATDLVPAEYGPVLVRAFEEAWDTGRPVDFETPALGRPDGLTWYAARVAPVRRDGRTLGLVVVARDITGRKRAEHERAALDGKFQEAWKLESLGVLAGGIAHDFNNLLTGILGNANLARVESPPGAPALTYLEQIEKISVRAADLCKQMLAYAGKGRVFVEPVNLSRVVEDMTHLLRASVAPGVTLTFTLLPSLPAVHADAAQMRQVVLNLVVNASEAIGARGGRVEVSTAHTRVPPDPELPEGDYVCLQVRDDGPGIPEVTRARVFDPFFTTKFAGRGLGLAAVQGIARAHGGAARVASEPGRETTFRVLLPCAPGAAGRPAAPGREKTVLVADDDETVRAVAARMLESLGYGVVLACDGREAVERFRAEPDRFGWVLLDLTMPHMSGEAAFREMRRARPDVRVLLMSGYAEQEVNARMAEGGLAGFLQKPFPLSTLQARIREMTA